MFNSSVVNILIMFGRLCSKAAGIASEAARAIDRIEHQKYYVSKSACDYNMRLEPNELYYREFYFDQLKKALKSTTKRGLSVLDLGCGQGRFLQFFASLDRDVVYTGVDQNVDDCQSLLERLNTEGMLLTGACISADIAEYIEQLEKEQFDIILFNEVAFFFPAWESLLPTLWKLLRPSGVFQMSQRSSYFSAALVVKNQFESWADVEPLVEGNSGNLFGTGPLFTWDTKESLEKKIKDAGFEILDVLGIGVLSGIHGDIHGHLCQPYRLDASSREKLFALENFYGNRLPETGRYMSMLCLKNG